MLQHIDPKNPRARPLPINAKAISVGVWERSPTPNEGSCPAASWHRLGEICTGPCEALRNRQADGAQANEDGPEFIRRQPGPSSFYPKTMAQIVRSSLIFAVAFLVLLCMPAAAQTREKDTESGQQARTAQDFRNAEKQFKAAIHEARHSGASGLQLAESLDGLAAVYRDQKKYAASETLYKETLAIKETILGPWHPSLAETLDNLSGVFESQGKHQQAEPLDKRAHQIREQAVAIHPDVYVDGVPKPVLHPK